MKCLLAIFCFLSVSAIAQDFPEDWLGSYQGEMLIANAGRPTDTIDVTYEMITLEEDSIWTYKMTFYSDKYGTIVKDYKIVAKSKENEFNYLLDENNGIVMEMTLMDGTFYGMYKVMDMMYVTTMRYTEGDAIYYDLFAAPMANPTVTSTEGEEPIEATSYGTILHQTALFKPVQ
ncbi:MAG: hypothetical protein Crog4KO_15660 [Crocinitomicaceae bacterium]